ncbi:MAG: serine hydrolase domain-containing protein [Terriglobia bacterium]|jgi:CubicO group peptidase (beta-lactamase class C family)
MPKADRDFPALLVPVLALSMLASFSDGYSKGAATTPQSRPDVSRMEQVIQSFVSDQHFMGSVLVARGNDVILDKGYGFANLEWQIPNLPSTKFRLGSITKQFTAASILLLAERGKLSVNDPVKKYLPMPRQPGTRSPFSIC